MQLIQHHYFLLHYSPASDEYQEIYKIKIVNLDKILNRM